LASSVGLCFVWCFVLSTSAGRGAGAPRRPGGGGEIDGTSAGTTTITKSVNVAGVGGSTGLIDLFAQRDIVVNNSIIGTDATGGATLSLEAAHDLSLADTGLASNLRLAFNASADGAGGDITLSAGNDLTIAGFLLDASGAGFDVGGSIIASAGRHMSINQRAVLNANSTATSNKEGGHIDLEAGFDGTLADLAGNLQIDGTITAMGHAPGAVAAPASIKLKGCQTTISGTALVDSTGDPGAFNLITGRSGITIQSNGKLKTTAAAAGGQNVPAFPTGTAPSVSGTAVVSPPLSNCGGSCAKAVCTSNNPPAPTGCLMPCPTCGANGVQFPEECDPPSCAGNCDLHCRHICGPTPCTPCSDGNPCTTDTCDATFGCTNEGVASGTTCEDGNVCNGHEKCLFIGDVELCTPDASLDCDDDNPCTIDTCDAQSGCAHAPITGAGSGGCDDGCVERCASGTCVAITPPNCSDGNPMTRDFCNPQLCTSPGSQTCCDHALGQPCTLPSECNDGNPCTNDTCSGNPSICHNEPADGTPCPNGTRCDGDEICQNGSCTNGTPVNCADTDPCTDDVCDAATGACSHPRIPNCCQSVADCNDNNVCTSDTCVAQVCDHAVNPSCCATDADCNDGNPCTQDSACVANSCTHGPLSGAQPGCGDVCTSGTCNAGTCALGAPVVCASDGDMCTDDVCDPSAGCVHRAIDGCCHNDVECHEQPSDDPCTTDACDPDAHVCINTPVFLGCNACSTDADCDPNRACGQSVCDTAAGHCTDPSPSAPSHYTPPSCTDGNARTQDRCVVDGPRQAHCEHPCFPGVCDDHNVCNGIETCADSTAICGSGTPLDCDDHDGCTDDRCDPATGCAHPAKTGYDSARCRLDAMALALQEATDASPAARAKLGSLVGKARRKIEAAAAAGSGKPALRALKAAGKQLKAIGKATNAALKKKKIGQPLADALSAALQGATQAVETLKASITP
jgi:hypothetical protein